MTNFRDPFGTDILHGARGDNGAAYQEDVGIRVGEGTKKVVIFLSGSIPKIDLIGLFF